MELDCSPCAWVGFPPAAQEHAHVFVRLVLETNTHSGACCGGEPVITPSDGSSTDHLPNHNTSKH